MDLLIVKISGVSYQQPNVQSLSFLLGPLSVFKLLRRHPLTHQVIEVIHLRDNECSRRCLNLGEVNIVGRTMLHDIGHKTHTPAFNLQFLQCFLLPAEPIQSRWYV